MIVITIELWRKRNPKDKVHLGTAIITNTGEGTRTKGNYKAILINKARRKWKTTKIKNFPRQKLLVWDLLYRILRKLFQERN